MEFCHLIGQIYLLGHLLLSPLLCTCVSPPHLPATHRRPVPLVHSTLPHARCQTSASLSSPHCHTHHHGPHTSWSSSSLPGWEDKEGGREKREGEKSGREGERETDRQRDRLLNSHTVWHQIFERNNFHRMTLFKFSWITRILVSHAYFWIVT